MVARPEPDPCTGTFQSPLPSLQWNISLQIAMRSKEGKMIRPGRSIFTQLLIPLLLLLVGCGSNPTGTSSSGSQTPCNKQSAIRGTIVTISQAPSGGAPSYVGAILLDGTK